MPSGSIRTIQVYEKVIGVNFNSLTNCLKVKKIMIKKQVMFHRYSPEDPFLEFLTYSTCELSKAASFCYAYYAIYHA